MSKEPKQSKGHAAANISTSSSFIKSAGDPDAFFKPAAQVTTSGAAPVQMKEKAAALPKDIKLTIAADKEAEFLSKEYIDNSAVGHSWIMLEKPGGVKDSYGFWPANLGSGGGFDASQPWKSVAGEVRHPDTSHTPNAKYSVNIDSTGLATGEKYATSKASADYNLLSYNCTTFAREFFYKSSGSSAPSAGMLIEDPNALYDSIEMINGARGLDPNENAKPSKKSAPKSK
jgi:hypothetical protein